MTPPVGLSGIGSTSRRTSVEQANEALQKAICSGELAPGQKLVVSGLAEALGMSITPVREALRQLERQGLVVDSPYAGMRVSALSIEELDELLEIRGVLDGYAVARGLPRLTDEDLAKAHDLVAQMDEAIAAGDAERCRDLNTDFHAVLIMSGAPPGGTLARSVDEIQLRAQRYSAAARQAMPPDALRASNEEHKKLLELIAAGDTAHVERFCRVHAATFAQNLAQALGMTR